MAGLRWGAVWCGAGAAAELYFGRQQWNYFAAPNGYWDVPGEPYTVAPGSDAQIFMFVGGKLASADPSASVANFEQTYQAAKLALVQAQAARLSDTAGLFQALGGGWWNQVSQVAEK